MKTAIAIKTKASVGVLLAQQIFLGTCYAVCVIGVGAALILAAVSLAVPAAVAPGSVIALGSANTVTLTWTASGDDGDTGQASEYDIRYATFPINEENFSTATAIVNPPAPQIAVH